MLGGVEIRREVSRVRRRHVARAEAQLKVLHKEANDLFLPLNYDFLAPQSIVRDQPLNPSLLLIVGVCFALFRKRHIADRTIARL
jgi:hypothetical protein